MISMAEKLRKAGLVTDEDVARAETWKREMGAACTEAMALLARGSKDIEKLRRASGRLEELESTPVIATPVADDAPRIEPALAEGSRRAVPRRPW